MKPIYAYMIFAVVGAIQIPFVIEGSMMNGIALGYVVGHAVATMIWAR